eukprot:10000589-Alexandrium_andersonii.AAC.1
MQAAARLPAGLPRRPSTAGPRLCALGYQPRAPASHGEIADGPQSRFLEAGLAARALPALRGSYSSGAGQGRRAP